MTEQFFLFVATPDGPSRIQGQTLHTDLEVAESTAAQYASQVPGRIVGVAKIVSKYESRIEVGKLVLPQE